MPKCSIKHLRNVWHYDPSTGHFYWKIHASRKFRKGDRAGSLKDKRGYVELSYCYHRYYAHRVAWAFRHNQWPTHDVDHIDGDKSNNAISNLRHATRAQNIAYKPVKNQSLTGRKGVHKDRRDGRFYPYIDIDGHRQSLGGFDTLEEANDVRVFTERKHWKDFSWLR